MAQAKWRDTPARKAARLKIKGAPALPDAQVKVRRLTREEIAAQYPGATVSAKTPGSLPGA